MAHAAELCHSAHVIYLIQQNSLELGEQITLMEFMTEGWLWKRVKEKRVREDKGKRKRDVGSCY